ncbi:MAG: DUF2851 family protein [Prolixibacteraceae bacterium]
MMNEEFLQYSWKYQLFQKENLETTSGERIRVINPGRWNLDSGPDFFNASIKIGDTLWAGNVEVHTKSSDWMKHNHHTNDAYNNVILHVVEMADQEVSLPNGQDLPTLVIRLEDEIRSNYLHLIAEEGKPACHQTIGEVDPIYIQAAINSMLVERIEAKTKIIERTLQLNHGNWNETFYQHLSMNFGFKTNALPFEMLARSLPLNILVHHTKSLSQLEAMLFGQSGLLNEELLGDDYFLTLRKEYSYLANKYGLKGMEGHVWKFMRLRPANFPTIRISQFAALLHQSQALFSKMLDTNDLDKIQNFFEIKASEYWDSHYRFNVASKKKVKWLGRLSQNNLLINTVVPFLYSYGDRNNKPQLKDRAFELLERIPSEQNQIIARWTELGINSSNAYDSQALIQLKNVYCDYKKCLQCQIGTKVINR